MTSQFNHRNGLDFICRGHQIAQNGFNWMHKEQIVTVFSAANAYYRMGNDAAIMELDENMRHEMVTFFAAPN